MTHGDIVKHKLTNMEKRNNSELSYIDCMIRLTDESRDFEDMTTDDLDSIYFCAFGRWAYHMTRDGYINALKNKRNELSKCS